MNRHGALPGRVDETAARRVCEALYWTPERVTLLPGEVDSNFLVSDAFGERFVLKVGSPTTEREPLALQERVLTRLEASRMTAFPRVVRSRQGRWLESVRVGDSQRLVRMLTHLPGHMLAELPGRPPALLASLGRLLGRMDGVLATMDVAGAIGRTAWDLARLGESSGLAELIADASDRRLAEATIARYVERRTDLAGRLRRGLIHNDANDHNVVVSSLEPEAAQVVGLIDFGDLVKSDRLNELAVAMAYAGFGAVDPWSTALPVLSGYHRENPLTPEEIELLFPAVCARLAHSVCVSARRRGEGLADDYALISEAPAWAALRSLAAIDATAATNAARLITSGVAAHV